MSYYEDNKVLVTKFLDILEEHFGTEVEFVVHDLTLDYERTIVDIRNGHITGRKVNDTGDMLGLQFLSGEDPKNSSYSNMIGFTPDGRILRSSTLFLGGEGKHAEMCIAINEDITKSVEYEKYLHECNRIKSNNEFDISTGRGDVNKMLSCLMEQAQLEVGKSPQNMTREDKLHFIQYLDKRGAFLISKSGLKVCEALNISKFTLYNYLDALRNKTDVNLTE